MLHHKDVDGSPAAVALGARKLEKFYFARDPTYLVIAVLGSVAQRLEMNLAVGLTQEYSK